MQGEINQGNMLSELCIWVIDDDIPLHTLKVPEDGMMGGLEPINRTVLRQLTDGDAWEDAPLQELCRQLSYGAKSVAAFLRPEPAIAHLRGGAIPPDALVFDMDYRGISEQDVVKSLETILRDYLCIVQVYSKEADEHVSRLVAELLESYSARMEKPRNKAQTSPEMLSNAIAQRLTRSLSVRMARRIREVTISAVEKVLVKIDDLPLDLALQALAGRIELPSEEEFLEMLSVKVSEALGNSEELTSAIQEFASEKGMVPDKSGELACGIVSLVVSHIREAVRGDGQLYDDLVRAWGIAQPPEPEDGGKNNTAAQDFVGFQLYNTPTDDIVRSGDIVKIPARSNEEENPSTVYLVITPACDLERFYKKTRGALTFASMYQLDEVGKAKVNSYGNVSNEKPHSITARAPMVFPSIPIGNNRRADYALFAHELAVEVFEVTDLIEAGSGNKEIKKPLRYSNTNDRIVRLCRLSEPYLSGVLSKLGSDLFQTGVPDFPEVEKERLWNSLKIVPEE